MKFWSFKGGVEVCLAKALVTHFGLGVLAVLFFAGIEELIDRAGVHSLGLEIFFLLTDIAIAVAVAVVTTLNVMLECFFREALLRRDRGR